MRIYKTLMNKTFIYLLIAVLAACKSTPYSDETIKVTFVRLLILPEEKNMLNSVLWLIVSLYPLSRCLKIRMENCFILLRR